MKLLIDTFGSNYSESYVAQPVISESTGDGKDKKYYIKGPFAQAEQENRNGRNYPKSVMENAIDKYQYIINSKRALGEMKHPLSPQVDLERASHIIESLEWDGNNVIGKARILTNLPMGMIAKGLIDEGVQFGVSTRGLGSLVEKNGVKIVQPDFMIAAIDIVGDPSGPDCFVQGIMENREWIYVNGVYSDQHVETTKKEILSAKSGRITEMTTTAFHNFLLNIK